MFFVTGLTTTDQFSSSSRRLPKMITKYSITGFVTRHHKRAVAQPCVNGDRLSKGRMAKIRPRADPKPLNRSTQNLKQVIMSARWPPVQNFVQIRPLRASRQMGEI